MAVPASPVDAELHTEAWNHPEGLVIVSCTISRWRGYVSSTFVALVDDGTPVAESPAFRCRGQADPPDSGNARAAYDELRAALEQLGWEEVDGQTATWCAGRFTRMVSVPVARPVADAQVVEAPLVVEPEPRLFRETPVHCAAPPRPKPPLAPAPRVEPTVEPAPRGVEEAPATPSVAQSAAEAPRRSRIVTIVSVLGLIVALALTAYLALGHGARLVRHASATPVAATQPTHTVATATHTAAAPAPATPAATHATPAPAQLGRPATVRLTIRADQRASWFEIRRGSATGPVLFSGELAPGKPLHFTGQRLWSRFGAAGNLTITANGHPVTLLGTFEHVFLAPKR
jgi:Domain of unknown function (DUF4115)